jgi:hypothetical protein
MVLCFATYTKNKYKGRGFDHVTLKGVDTISANYKPWTKFKPNCGANYTIQVLHNTSINHILGTVGITAVEYCGETVVKDQITIEEYRVPTTSYNIVQ